MTEPKTPKPNSFDGQGCPAAVFPFAISSSHDDPELVLARSSNLATTQGLFSSHLSSSRAVELLSRRGQRTVLAGSALRPRLDGGLGASHHSRATKACRQASKQESPLGRQLNKLRRRPGDVTSPLVPTCAEIPDRGDQHSESHQRTTPRPHRGHLPSAANVTAVITQFNRHCRGEKKTGAAPASQNDTSWETTCPSHSGLAFVIVLVF